jgi:hypothetical protein
VIGERVIGREQAEAYLEAVERAETHYHRGTLGQERSVGAHRRARVAAGRLAQQDPAQEDEPS